MAIGESMSRSIVGNHAWSHIAGEAQRPIAAGFAVRALFPAPVAVALPAVRARAVAGVSRNASVDQDLPDRIAGWLLRCRDAK